MKIIILGASHGGAEAVETALLEFPTAEIFWVEQQALSHLLGWPMEKVVLYRNQLKAKGVRVLDQTRAVRLEGAHHTLVVQETQSKVEHRLVYDKLILSPGAQARTLSVPGNQLRGLVSLRGRADLDWLRQQSTGNAAIQHVVVIGAGCIGVSAAEMFAVAGKQVTLVDVNDRVLHGYLDAELTEPLTEAFTAHQVTLALAQRVQQFDGDATGHVTTVVTDQKSYSADLVVVAVGGQPNTDWLVDQLAILPNGSIQTDTYLRTSMPDVFAIGDAVQVVSGATGKRVNVALAADARREAYLAVRNLVSPRQALPPVQGTSALKVFDLTFATTGLGVTAAERAGVPVKAVVVTQPVALHDATPVTLKLMYQPATLEIVGAQLIAATDMTANINSLALAIQTHMTIHELATADFFFQPLFTTPVHFLNAVGMAAVRQAETALGEPV